MWVVLFHVGGTIKKKRRKENNSCGIVFKGVRVFVGIKLSGNSLTNYVKTLTFTPANRKIACGRH